MLGIIPGIKVDAGAKDLAAHPGEKVTEGLDGLRDRLAEYSRMGARFAKWRAVIVIGDHIPSRACLEVNAHALARYARSARRPGLLPIVEPEVLMDGGHTLQQCGEVTEEVLCTVFSQLNTQGVALEGMILKPNMVVPGLLCPKQESVDEVADATVTCFLRTVPAAVPGIAFLSGGQSAELASARLNAMIVRFKSRMPWALAFSYSRAIQQPALEIWHGDDANVPAARKPWSIGQIATGLPPRGIHGRHGKGLSMALDFPLLYRQNRCFSRIIALPHDQIPRKSPVPRFWRGRPLHASDIPQDRPGVAPLCDRP